MDSREEKKNAIIDAAEAIIAAKGYSSMIMDQVAEEADVAKGTLYLYFKNKNSLCAAVNARINKELNYLMKKKMDLFQTGSEKVVASGTATVEFSLKNQQKWKAGTELYQMKYEDPNDPHVQELLREVHNMVQMLAEAYKQGIEDGTMRRDLDPVPTAIYNRMALSNAFTPTSEQKLLLELYDISAERYLSVAWNLINRSTHIKPSIREESEKTIENRRSGAEIGKEVKGIVDSLGLPADDALEIFNAWEIVTRIIMGKTEYRILGATKSRLVFDVTDCTILNSIKETDDPIIDMVNGCRNYCTSVVETLNPKYTQRFVKMVCDGDDYCQGIIELKKGN